MSNESETIEQVFERCTSTDFSSRDREEILRAMQEYADLQVKAFKEKLKKQLEYEDREVDWITIEYIQKLIDRI